MTELAVAVLPSWAFKTSPLPPNKLLLRRQKMA
jgi:hypothetical protein